MFWRIIAALLITALFIFCLFNAQSVVFIPTIIIGSLMLYSWKRIFVPHVKANSVEDHELYLEGNEEYEKTYYYKSKIK